MSSSRMPQQPERSLPPRVPGPVLVSAPRSNSDSQPPPAGGRQTPPNHRIPLWLERAELFLRVLLRMYIGIAICYAPWSHSFWDQNPIFLQFPTLGVFAANGAVRGLVSGLGLLNLWIAFQDAVHHWDK